MPFAMELSAAFCGSLLCAASQNPVLNSRAALSDADGTGVAPLDHCITCGSVRALRPVSPAAARWAFFKRNLPSIISICSVILNVIIISRLIPDMQSSISEMQGQAQSVQTQVNSINSLLFAVNNEIRDAESKIDVFNGKVAAVTQTLNTTQADIATFSQTTLEQLNDLQTTAALTIDGFKNSSVAIQRQLNASQEVADATLGRLNQASASLDMKAAAYTAAANDSLQQLLLTNHTVITRVEAVRDDFTTRIAPEAAAAIDAAVVNFTGVTAPLAQAAIDSSVADFSAQIFPAANATLQRTVSDFQRVVAPAATASLQSLVTDFTTRLAPNASSALHSIVSDFSLRVAPNATTAVQNAVNDFTQRTVPAVVAGLQSLNMSAAIDAQAKQVVALSLSLNQSLSAPVMHYVENPDSGLGSAFGSFASKNGVLQLPRFWRDLQSGVVHLEGVLAERTSGCAGQYPCTMFTLPEGAQWRPTQVRQFPCLVSVTAGTYGEVHVKPTGEVILVKGNTGAVVIDGISFEGGQ